MKKKVCSVISIILSVVCFALGLIAFLISAIDTIQISTTSVLAGQGFSAEEIGYIQQSLGEESKDAVSALKDIDSFTPDKVNEALLNLADYKDGVKKFKKIKADAVSALETQAKSVAKRNVCYVIAAIGIVVGIIAIVLLKFTGGPEVSKAPTLSNLAKIGILLEVIVIVMFAIRALRAGMGL